MVPALTYCGRGFTDEAVVVHDQQIEQGRTPYMTIGSNKCTRGNCGSHKETPQDRVRAYSLCRVRLNGRSSGLGGRCSTEEVQVFSSRSCVQTSKAGEHDARSASATGKTKCSVGDSLDNQSDRQARASTAATTSFLFNSLHPQAKSKVLALGIA